MDWKREANMWCTGTFVLTEEPVMEPPQKLREAMKAKGLPEEGVFDVVAIGEGRVF